MTDEIPIEDLSEGIIMNKLTKIKEIIKYEYIVSKFKSLVLKGLIILLFKSFLNIYIK